MNDDADAHEIALINAIEEISTDGLKKVSYRKFIEQLVEISARALRYDSTRILLLLDVIKSCSEACYKRDLLFDVLRELFSSNEVLVGSILSHPFPDENRQGAWKELANAIATIPDLSANCRAQSRISLFTQDLFHRRLLDAIYASLDTGPKPLEEHRKLFLVQLIGRISFSDNGTLLWRHFTLRVINETRDEIRSIAAQLLRAPLLTNLVYESFELFIDHLYQPMFFHLKPSDISGNKLYSILGNGAETNDHLRYMLCDKSIFKTNNCLDIQRQSIVLFNIAAYLSRLVNFVDHRTNDGENNECNLANKASLLITALLKTIEQWSSATKSLLRTYEQSRHITMAAILLFRFALQYDKKSLAEHANDIESMIASAMPTYLNRASREHRELGMCLAELLLPKLLELRVNSGPNERASDPLMSWKFDHTDDLLYLHRLFKEDVEVIFEGLTDDAGACSNVGSCGGAPKTESSNKDQSSLSSQSGPLEFAMEETTASTVSAVPVTDASSRIKPIVELLDDKTATNIESTEDDDDDLKPYAMCADHENHGAADDQEDDAEYDPEASAANVPIYLRDCIDGLVENGNYRYVRLCLIKAGELIEQLMLDDVVAGDQQMLSEHGRLNYSNTIGSSTHQAGRQMVAGKSEDEQINATIKDVGVELARTLLFLDNQFNIEGFKYNRMKALTALCVAAPQLIGKYLIDEFNGSNRSMQQQLDILQILMESAERLSGPPPIVIERGEEVGAISSGGRRKQTRQPQKRINRFSAHAALYFYGIVYRLKADFMESSRSLVIAQPKSILSAFRQLKCESSDDDHCHPAADSMQLSAKTRTAAASRLKRLQSTIISLEEGDIDRDDSTNADGFLERNSLSDDSYLLSRIIFATSIVLRCASQQLVSCKLSGDLLEILAAYRCHPDAGVQKSMIAGLKAIRHCTPQVYLENFLERRMVELFGPWLARLDDLDTQSSSRWSPSAGSLDD